MVQRYGVLTSFLCLSTFKSHGVSWTLLVDFGFVRRAVGAVGEVGHDLLGYLEEPERGSAWRKEAS